MKVICIKGFDTGYHVGSGREVIPSKSPVVDSIYVVNEIVPVPFEGYGEYIYYRLAEFNQNELWLSDHFRELSYGDEIAIQLEESFKIEEHEVISIP